VFQWFPLYNLITAEPILWSIFDKQRLFCLMRQKQFSSYVVSSYTQLFEVIT